MSLTEIQGHCDRIGIAKSTAKVKFRQFQKVIFYVPTNRLADYPRDAP